MARRTARVDGSGRLVIPATVRRELELRDGDEVVFAVGDAPREVRMMPRRAALAHAQALVREHAHTSGSAVDDLLSERRGEAAREAVTDGVRQGGRRSSRPR